MSRITKMPKRGLYESEEEDDWSEDNSDDFYDESEEKVVENLDPNIITVKVQKVVPGPNHLKFMKIAKDIELRWLMICYCETLGMEYLRTKFMFNGASVRPGDTPLKLSMVDGDVISVGFPKSNRGVDQLSPIWYQTLCIRAHKRRDTFVRVARDELLLRSIKRNFSDSKNGKHDSTCFFYKGQKLDGRDTANMLRIEDGDIIDAFNFKDHRSSLGFVSGLPSTSRQPPAFKGNPSVNMSYNEDAIMTEIGCTTGRRVTGSRRRVPIEAAAAAKVVETFDPILMSRITKMPKRGLYGSEEEDDWSEYNSDDFYDESKEKVVENFDPNTITVKVQKVVPGPNHLKFMKIAKDIELRWLMICYCETLCMEYRNTKFMFKSALVRPGDTPLKLSMVDGDVISVGLPKSNQGVDQGSPILYQTLCIRAHKRRHTFVRVPCYESLLRSIKRNFYDSKNGKHDSTCYFYKGQKLVDRDTANMLRIEDGDIIDAFNFEDHRSSLGFVSGLPSTSRQPPAFKGNPSVNTPNLPSAPLNKPDEHHGSSSDPCDVPKMPLLENQAFSPKADDSLATRTTPKYK